MKEFKLEYPSSCDFLLDSNTPSFSSFASSDVLSGLSLVLNSSSLPLSLSLWVPSSVWPEPSEGHVEQKFTTRFFDEKDKRKVLRRNEVYEDVNTKANVNKFDFLLNTFTKYCYTFEFVYLTS